jgi:hypothetical protein
MSKLLDAFAGCELDEPAFITLLTEVMKHSESVQNDPKQGFVPKEGLVAAQLVEILKPYSTENGGKLFSACRRSPHCSFYVLDGGVCHVRRTAGARARCALLCTGRPCLCSMILLQFVSESS